MKNVFWRICRPDVRLTTSELAEALIADALALFESNTIAGMSDAAANKNVIRDIATSLQNSSVLAVNAMMAGGVEHGWRTNLPETLIPKVHICEPHPPP